MSVIEESFKLLFLSFFLCFFLSFFFTRKVTAIGKPFSHTISSPYRFNAHALWRDKRYIYIYIYITCFPLKVPIKGHCRALDNPNTYAPSYPLLLLLVSSLETLTAAFIQDSRMEESQDKRRSRGLSSYIYVSLN